MRKFYALSLILATACVSWKCTGTQNLANLVAPDLQIVCTGNHITMTGVYNFADGQDSIAILYNLTGKKEERVSLINPGNEKEQLVFNLNIPTATQASTLEYKVAYYKAGKTAKSSKRSLYCLDRAVN